MAKKKKPSQQQPISPKKYIIEAARKVPIYECLINEGWQNVGLAQIFVTRKKYNGNLIVGFYLVDLFCMGIRFSEHYHDMSEEDYKIEIKRRNDRLFTTFEKINSNKCFNLIYGAVEYAEDLGFQPNKGFDISEYILEPVESIDYEEVEFGKNGRPLYRASSFDRYDKAINTLNKSVGKGNFDIEIPKTNVYNMSDENPSSVFDLRIGLQFNFDKEEKVDLTESNFFNTYKETNEIEIGNEHVDFYPDDEFLADNEIENDLVDITMETVEQFYEKSSYSNLYTFIPADSFKNRRDFLKTQIFTGKQNRLNANFGAADTFIEHFPAVVADAELYEFLTNQTLFQYFETFYERLRQVKWNENYEITLALVFETPEEYAGNKDIFCLNIMMTEKE